MIIIIPKAVDIEGHLWNCHGNDNKGTVEHYYIILEETEFACTLFLGTPT